MTAKDEFFFTECQMFSVACRFFRKTTFKRPFKWIKLKMSYLAILYIHANKLLPKCLF